MEQRLWVAHLKENPAARDDFLAFCREAKQECYIRVLDGDEKNIDYMRGKRDTYLILEGSMSQIEKKELDQLELEQLVNRSFIKW